jgi:quercetin dioxygenase-like cupin family protein
MTNVNKMYGNVWIFKVILSKKGDMKVGHKHEFDHIHQVLSGRGLITCYEGLQRDTVLYKKEIVAGRFYRVPKEHVHSIEALEDGYVGQCIHALRNEDNSVYETDLIKDINAGDIEFFPDGTIL